MNQLKKNLLLLAVAVSLVVVGASTAFAVVFNSSSDDRATRVIGVAEASDTLELTTFSGGGFPCRYRLHVPVGLPD